MKWKDFRTKRGMNQMKSNSEKKTTRKGRMGIVTNRMSDEVYNMLNSKAQKNQLSQYIIELVEKDINNRYILEREKMVSEKMDDLERKIDTMDRLLDTTKEQIDIAKNQDTDRYETIQEQKWEHSSKKTDHLTEQIQKNILFINRQSYLLLSSAVQMVESWYSIEPHSDKYR